MAMNVGSPSRGSDMDVMIDNHGTSRPQQAIRMLAAVDDRGLLFFEEPCPPDNPDVLEPIARRGFITRVSPFNSAQASTGVT